MSFKHFLGHDGLGDNEKRIVRKFLFSFTEWQYRVEKREILELEFISVLAKLEYVTVYP